MIPKNETSDGTFPFEPRFSEAPGFRMHYVDEGDPSEEPIVLLHGELTWGYLYRNTIASLSRRHRVIVPDQVGFVSASGLGPPLGWDREILRIAVANLPANGPYSIS